MHLYGLALYFFVIRQTGECQNGGNKKTKHAKFFEKRTFLTPNTHTYVCVSGGKKIPYFGKLNVLCFLITSVLRFAISPYYSRFLCNQMSGRGWEAFIQLKELLTTVFHETLHKIVNSCNFIDVYLMKFDITSISIRRPYLLKSNIFCWYFH